MNKKLCPHCGASMMKNSYTMNKTLIRALVKLVRDPGKPIKDLGMSKGEYANVSKLKYWGFAFKSEDGIWWATSLGKMFLSGKYKAAKTVEYFRDEVVSQEGECDVWNIMPTEESKQKYRELMTPYLGEYL